MCQTPNRYFSPKKKVFILLKPFLGSGHCEMGKKEGKKKKKSYKPLKKKKLKVL